MLNFAHYDRSLIFVTVCLAFYISAVLCMPLRTSFEIFVLITICTIFVLSFSYQKLKNFTIKPQKYKPISFWHFFLVNLLIFSFYLYATWPGCMTFDMMCQWYEIQEGQFTDWHPAIHTMMIWFFAKIYNNFSFVIICQVTIFSVINSSLFYELSKKGLPKNLIWIAFFITTISPATTSHMLTLWKDSVFAIMILGLTEIFILTYLSNGEWIKSNFKIVLTGILLGCTTLVRHNGFFFTLPFFLIFLCLFYNRYVIKLCLIALATILVIKWPLYSYLNVIPHTQPQAELCGVPMTILSEIFVKNPSVIDKETSSFLLSIENYDIWTKKYQSGSWNSVKFKTFSDVKNRLSSTANAAILRFSAKKVFSKAFQASLKNPDLALNACINLTRLVWAICFVPAQLFITPPINALNLSDKLSPKNFHSLLVKDKYKKNYGENNLVRSSNDVSITKTLCQVVVIGISVLFSSIFRIGIYMLILMLTAFFSFHRLRWKAFWIIFPILTYNFGTMLLLCSFNEYRFFFFNVLITFPYMFLLFADKKFITNQFENFPKK